MIVLPPIYRERCIRDAIGVTAIQVCTVFDAGEIRDGGDESGLLWAAEHEIGERDLHGTVESVECINTGRALGTLLGVGRRVTFRLMMEFTRK